MKRFLPFLISIFTFNCIAGVTDWIDFKLEGGHIKIPVTIAGIETQAILDTGAQVNAINNAFIIKNKLDLDKGSKMRIKGLFGIQERPTYNNIPISFFGLESELDNIVQSSLGYHTNGLLLGGGFFDKFVVQLDYPNSKMRLMTHDTVSVKDFKNIEIQRQKGTGMPIVKVRLHDQKSLWLLLDTGNAGGMIVNRQVANKMGWLENRETQSTVSAGVISNARTGEFSNTVVRFWSIQLRKRACHHSSRRRKILLGESISKNWVPIKRKKSTRVNWIRCSQTLSDYH